MLSPSAKVVIADDHELMRDALVELVSEFIPRENICCASNGEQAISYFNDNLGLLLLDLFMPGTDTFSIIRDALKALPGLTIVVISASEEELHINKAIKLGAKGYIPKSSSKSTIKEALKSILDGQPYHPDIPKNGSVKIASSIPDLVNKKAIEQLTARQLEIFYLLGFGKTNKDIADELYISINTVKIHVSAILNVLSLDNRTQAGIMSKMLRETSGFNFKQH